MALEFALRPRINLDRPPPRRRLRWLRLPPLALPLALYWLAIAGGTHALHQMTTADVAPDEPEVREETRAVELDEPTPSVVTTAPRPDLEPPLAAAEPAKDFPSQPALEPPKTSQSEREPPLELRAERTTTRERTFELTAREPDLASEPLRSARNEPKARTLRSETRREEPWDPFAALAEPERERERQPEPTRRETLRAPAVPEPAREPARDESRPASSLPSCESAAASSNETMDLRGARGAADLTRGAFAAVLENGAYLGRCPIPASTALEICAAVQDGKVVGVSVTTEPRNATISACVRRAVAGLRFPKSSRLDVTRTRFEAAR